MPGLALHFVLATQALERLRAADAPNPFGLDDPSALNAFLHGSMGPDSGYLPGGFRPMSELAHSMRTGALTSELITSARTPTERAFAWGWLTHVLGDRLIHPWIGRGVGELRYGSRDHFVSGAADTSSHLRVELGVDAWFAAHNRDLLTVRLRPAFDSVTVAFVERAFAVTYGEELPKGVALRSHLSAGRRIAQGLASLRLLGALVDEEVLPLAMPGLRWILKMAYETDALRGVALAYLNPVAPSLWLLREIEHAVELHGDLFAEVVRDGGGEIGDFDLDTGQPLRTPARSLAGA